MTGHHLQPPLDGVRVLSFSTGIAAPYAGRILSQCGAEVIKVESRRGGIDSFRYFGETEDVNASTRFAEMNFGLKSLTVNLKHPDGLRVIRELVKHCDVVMDNFRADVLDGLGLGYEQLREAREDIIVLKMPGMGLTGPRSSYGTWGATLNAFSGLTYAWNHPDQPAPVGAQGSYPDYVAAGLAAAIVLAALHDRRRTGLGRLLDLAQVEAAAYMLGVSFLDADINVRVPQPEGNLVPGASPSGTFRCTGADRWCSVSVETDAQWRALARVMGRHDVADDPRYQTAAGRLKHRSALNELVGSWLHGMDAFDAMERLQGAGVPAGVTQTGEDLAADPQLQHRGFIKTVDQPGMHKITAADVPVRLRTSPILPPGPAPRLGEHTDYVMRDILGYPEEKVRLLRAEEVLI